MVKYSFEQVYADMKKEHLGVIEAACDILGEESCQKFIKNEAETFGKFIDEHPVALQDDSSDDLPERFHAYICSTLVNRVEQVFSKKHCVFFRLAFHLAWP